MTTEKQICYVLIFHYSKKDIQAYLRLKPFLNKHIIKEKEKERKINLKGKKEKEERKMSF